jgi:hypothetical protein
MAIAAGWRLQIVTNRYAAEKPASDNFPRILFRNQSTTEQIDETFYQSHYRGATYCWQFGRGLRVWQT